jgi:hypothetical protein
MSFLPDFREQDEHGQVYTGFRPSGADRNRFARVAQ